MSASLPTSKTTMSPPATNQYSPVAEAAEDASEPGFPAAAVGVHTLTEKSDKGTEDWNKTLEDLLKNLNPGFTKSIPAHKKSTQFHFEPCKFNLLIQGRGFAKTTHPDQGQHYSQYRHLCLLQNCWAQNCSLYSCQYSPVSRWSHLCHIENHLWWKHFTGSAGKETRNLWYNWEIRLWKGQSMG